MLKDNPGKTSAFMQRSSAWARSKGAFPLAVLLFAVLVFLFFYRIATFQGFFLFEDILLSNLPWKIAYSNALKDGHLLLWTPASAGGLPLLAEGQTGALYSLNLLLFTVFEPYKALNLSFLIHAFMAGLFTYLYARSISLSWWSALLAAITFMFSGFLVTKVLHVETFLAVVWLPLGFFFVEKFFRGRSFVPILGAGMALSQPFLASHAQMATYAFLAALAYYLYRLFSDRQALLNLKRSLVGLVVMVGLPLLLAAPQFLAIFELRPLSERAGSLSFAARTLYSFLPQNLVTFLFPHFFGVQTPESIGDYWGMPSYWELAGYVGVVPFLLALLSVGRWRSPYRSFFWGMLVVSLLLALGRFSPLYWLVGQLPPFNVFRAPARFLYLATFSFAILGGHGLEALIESPKSRASFRRLVALSLGLALLGIAFASVVYPLVEERFIAWARSYVVSEVYQQPGFLNSLDYYNHRIDVMAEAVPKAFSLAQPRVSVTLALLVAALALTMTLGKRHSGVLAFCLVGLTAADLFLFGWGYNPTVGFQQAKIPPKSLSVIGNDSSRFRIASINGEPQISTEVRRELLEGAYANAFGIETADAASAIHVRSYSELVKIAGLGVPIENIRYRLLTHLNVLSMLNVKYLFTNVPLEHPTLELLYEDQATGVRVYLNEGVFPRAMVVPRSEIVADEAHLWDRLWAPDFNPQGVVLLETEPAALSSPATQGLAEVIRYEPTQVIIKAQVLGGSGFLLLSDTYYPGWEAWVDGQRKEIFRANMALRAVQLSEGTHTVEFRYEPRLLWLALWLSASAWLLCAIGIVYSAMLHNMGRRRKWAGAGEKLRS